MQAGLGMNKRCALSTHGVASCTLFSPVSLLVFTWSVGARISLALSVRTHKPPSTAPAWLPGPREVSTPTDERWRSHAGRPPGALGSRAPLNRADNDPRFPRQAFCCLVSLDLCGPSLSQLVPFCHRDKGLPRLVCTCVAFGSFRNALKLVISFVKPLSARLSETSKARGKLAC